MLRYVLLVAWLCVVAAETDRIVMTMGFIDHPLRAQIEALPIVKGPFQYTEFAGLIRVDGDEHPVTDLLDAAWYGIHYEVEMEKEYSFDVEPNIDRIDQKFLPLDNAPFNPVSGSTGLGEGVDIYIVDSGMLITHEEFQRPDNVNINRASSDYFVSGGSDHVPCSFHGTGVASIAGGKTLGVARKAFLRSVKVTTASGPAKSTGECPITLGNLLEGLLWIIANGTTPSIINLSLAGGRSVCVDLLVKKLTEDGNFVVDAAGNNNMLDGACMLSPARSSFSITVASSTVDDVRAATSNFGDCVDFFAPGQSVRVALATSNTSSALASGTSFAAPHVAGGAALIKSHLELLALNSSFPNVLQDLQDRAVTNNIAGAGPTNYFFLHVGADSSLTRPSVLLLFVLSSC